jgi:hypothetical protein
MKRVIVFTLLLSLPFILAQCMQDSDRNQMMDERQMSQMMQNPEQRQAMMNQMMQNPEQRQAMMSQMADNPEMRRQMMQQMRSSMMSGDRDMMLDRMEAMMNDPEQREQMKVHLQQMLAMMENGDFDRNKMREMMEESPMMGMHLNCMQMMSDM